MKFSEIESSRWDELKPYLDTCLLPLTGVTGHASPPEVTEALERLRDVMDWLEIPFKGRIVTYPAVHYRSGGEAFVQEVNRLCAELKEGGFRYVIAAHAEPMLNGIELEGADLVVSPWNRGGEPSSRQEAARLVSEMWSGKQDGGAEEGEPQGSS